MDVATVRTEVGIRDLKNNLSRYLERVRDGEEVVVTDHGRPIARLTSIEASTSGLAALIEAGLAQPPKSDRRDLPKLITASGIVSDLVADQRR